MAKLTKTQIISKLKNVAGFKELNNKQIMTRLASLAQDSVKNALKAAKITGGAYGAALTTLGMTAVSESKKFKEDNPSNGPKGRNVARKSKSGGYKNKDEGTAPKTSLKPKLRPKLVAMKDQGKGGTPGDGSTAVKKSLRPKPRPFKDGGMPMVMKDGKKVPAYAADGVGKMNKGGMAKKKPAAKKMMGGGMAKTGYMYGGMAKKTKAKK